MTTFVSLLRGINVGGHKKIRMADLRALYEGLGFKKVQSFIQSGNVVFDSSVEEAGTLSKQIEAAIQREFSFEVPVMIRTLGELRQVVERCPFGPIDIDKDGTRVLVTFLSGKPAEAGRDWLESEKLVIVGREAYVHFPDGVGKSKLSMARLEKKLGVAATGRNWKTVLRLVEMAAGAVD